MFLKSDRKFSKLLKPYRPLKDALDNGAWSRIKALLLEECQQSQAKILKF